MPRWLWMVSMKCNRFNSIVLRMIYKSQFLSRFLSAYEGKFICNRCQKAFLCFGFLGSRKVIKLNRKIPLLVPELSEQLSFTFQGSESLFLENFFFMPPLAPAILKFVCWSRLSVKHPNHGVRHISVLRSKQHSNSDHDLPSINSKI
jgi:hypothetical protein